MRLIKGGFQRRITIAVTLGMTIILLCFGIAGYLIIQQAVQESLNKQLALARLVRNHVDSIMSENLNRLYDISLSGRVDFSDGDFSPEKEALSIAHRYSIFTDGVFIIDRGGNILLNYPERMKDISLNVLSIEPVSRILSDGRPVVSNVYTTRAEKKTVIFMLVPLRDRNGVNVGLAGGEIDPTNPLLSSMLHLDAVGKSHISLIDSSGVIIASSDQPRAFTIYNLKHFIDEMLRIKEETITTCDDCYDLEGKRLTSHVLASAPLQTASWGIAVAEPVENVFAPVIKLKRIFIGLGIIFVSTTLIFSVAMARSIIHPVNELISAAGRIAGGNLNMPLPVRGSDEIGRLGHSFETMRVKLKEANEKMLQYNLELEERVSERTQEITESRERIQNLLERILTVQEDERKRIARELHDTTMQELSAVLMKVEMFELHPEEITPQKLEDMRSIIVNTLDEVNIITQNLRPFVIDDLGFEAAVRRLLEINLGEKKINYFLNISGLKNYRFNPEVEIRLYRIIQEAVMNIVRHAKAENVILDLDVTKSGISALIEDDGEGFDTDSFMQNTIHYSRDGRGLGLLGMRERAALLKGKFHISSSSVSGTRIVLRVPLGNGDKDEEGQSPVKDLILES